MVENLVRSLIREKQEHDFDTIMENPVGSLRKRPFMQSQEWRELTTDQHTVGYCAYGAEVRKSTNIWTSLRQWEPQGRSGN